ncbi:MAG: hypothetical protein M3O36_12215 [Myxococcota bacterium]|nr:hypothetical protein [Myxococcota bacterium]
MGSRWRGSFGPVVATVAFACGSQGSGLTSPCTTCSDAGSAPDSESVVVHAAIEGGRPSFDTNPDGIPYPNPATGYGQSARSGTTGGSVMQNFRFLGYPNADRSHGLTTIALSDYYDPCNRRLKLLHLSVAGVWCGPCNQETDAVVAAGTQLAALGVVMLQALDDGNVQNQPATKGDLDYWVTLHRSNFTSVLDPGLRNLGGFFDAAAIPWNCDIDPRTMEIIDESVGWSGNVLSDVTTALQSLPAIPSSPLPVQCP